MNKRFGERSISLLSQEETDGALSAPEMPAIRRDRGMLQKKNKLSLNLKTFGRFHFMLGL